MMETGSIYYLETWRYGVVRGMVVGYNNPISPTCSLRGVWIMDQINEVTYEKKFIHYNAITNCYLVPDGPDSNLIWLCPSKWNPIKYIC